MSWQWLPAGNHSPPRHILFEDEMELHAHRGKKLLPDLQTHESAATKRPMVRFRGAREKGAMSFVECLGFSQEDTMAGPLWRETLGRSVGSHDATELVGRMRHGNGCRQETTRLHAISCSKTGWSSTHTVGRSSCKISKPKKVRRRRDLW